MIKGRYPWWGFNYAVEYFNNNQINTVSDYVWEVFDKFMSDLFKQNMKTGELSKISFLVRLCMKIVLFI